MSNKHVWQGSFDMLCGLYSAAHLSACFGQRSSSKSYADLARIAFRNLVGGAEETGLFGAKQLTCRGYYDYELERIFMQLSSRKRANLIAIKFTTPWFRKLTNSNRREIIARGASAIIHEHGTSHWISLDGLHKDGGYRCFDPQITENTSHRERVRWDRGVLIAQRSLIEELNAQTH